jgi:DNA-binding transcriptional LysR family regulator
MQNQWSRRRKIELCDLIDEPWVLPPPDHLIGRLIADAFRAEGLKSPQAAVTTISIQPLVHLLTTGRYLAMLPNSMLHFSSKRLGLQVLPLKFSASPGPVAIITLKNRTISPVAQLFIKCAREVAKPLARGR